MAVFVLSFSIECMYVHSVCYSLSFIPKFETSLLANLLTNHRLTSGFPDVMKFFRLLRPFDLGIGVDFGGAARVHPEYLRKAQCISQFLPHFVPPHKFDKSTPVDLRFI